LCLKSLSGAIAEQPARYTYAKYYPRLEDFFRALVGSMFVHGFYAPNQN
jgi:hypothetical protein